MLYVKALAISISNIIFLKIVISDRILISNRNETYSKLAFGSQMVILWKILFASFVIVGGCNEI